MFRILLFTFLCSASCQAIVEESVTDIMSKILKMDMPNNELSKFYRTEKVDYFMELITEFGMITEFECSKNHDSLIFDTVACLVKYEQLKSGLVWEFYFFKSDEKWMGTNLGIIQEIPNDICVKNVIFIGQLGQGITYESVPCK